jgi:hypothetical protein
VVVPLIVPIARHFGVDPYHLGITFLLNLEIGYLTPPVGLNLFISSFRFRKPMVEVYQAVIPFIGILLITLVITTYVPFLSTWLPSLSKSKDLTQQEMGGSAPGAGEVPEAGDDGAFNLDNLDEAFDDEPVDLDNLKLDDLEVPEEPAAEPAAAPGEAEPAADAASAEEPSRAKDESPAKRKRR